MTQRQTPHSPTPTAAAKWNGHVGACRPYAVRRLRDLTRLRNRIKRTALAHPRIAEGKGVARVLGGRAGGDRLRCSSSRHTMLMNFLRPSGLSAIGLARPRN